MITTTSRWLITNTASGVMLGVFDGRDEAEALEHMAREFEFNNFAEQRNEFGYEDGDLLVERVPTYEGKDFFEWWISTPAGSTLLPVRRFTEMERLFLDVIDGKIWLASHWYDLACFPAFAHWLINRKRKWRHAWRVFKHAMQQDKKRNVDIGGRDDKKIKLEALTREIEEAGAELRRQRMLPAARKEAPKATEQNEIEQEADGAERLKVKGGEA